MFSFDSALGVDEVGRGPWAGPVVAAAACFAAGFRELPAFARLRDSKALSEPARERIMAELAPYRGTLFEYGLGLASSGEIDRINIRMATREAMDRALADLLARARPGRDTYPVACRIDGRDKFAFPSLPVSCEYVVKGDSIHPEIMLASIVAKVARDAMMAEYSLEHPGYGFERHKGYGTARHAAALAELGACPIHRASFRPVRDLGARRITG